MRKVALLLISAFVLSLAPTSAPQVGCDLNQTIITLASVQSNASYQNGEKTLLQEARAALETSGCLSA